jgi:hypothetical protein
MSDEREFKIKITTSADTSGMKAGETALDGLDSKTKQYVERLKETQAAEGGLELSHRQERMGLRLLTEQFGEAGRVIAESAHFGPLIGGLAAASYLFGEIQKHYAAIKAAMEAKIDVTNWSDLNAAIQHTAATLTQAVESADIFYDRIHRLESAQQSLVEKTNEAAATLKRQAEGADKARDAAEKTELAKISAQEKVGIISPEKAASEKAAIEQKYDKQRVDAAAQLDHQLIRQRVDERAAIESRGGARIDERTAAAEQAGTAASALGNAKARDEELGKQQAALEKYMTEHGKVLTLAQVQDERRKAQMVEA